MVCLMSATEVSKLTRMGKFDMQAPSSAPMEFLKKLRGKSAQVGQMSAEEKTSAGEKQMKMLRRLPKILRFIPGTAQDVRVYFLAMQYWLAGSQDNIQGLVSMLVDRYAAGPRAARLQLQGQVQHSDTQGAAAGGGCGWRRWRAAAVRPRRSCRVRARRHRVPLCCRPRAHRPLQHMDSKHSKLTFEACFPDYTA
jgi:hypothetical protein